MAARHNARVRRLEKAHGIGGTQVHYVIIRPGETREEVLKRLGIAPQLSDAAVYLAYIPRRERCPG